MTKFAKLLSVLAFLGGAAVLRADTAAPPMPQLSPADMSLKAAAIESGIQNDYQHVLYIKEQAKKQKDVIKLSCVNDKLVQLKAQMNIADGLNEQLQTALASGNDDRQTLFTQLSGTGDAVKRLREDAAVCIGEPELYKQEAGGSFTRPDLPDDPTHTPESGGEETPPEPPGYASPFR